MVLSLNLDSAIFGIKKQKQNKRKQKLFRPQFSHHKMIIKTPTSLFWEANYVCKVSNINLLQIGYFVGSSYYYNPFVPGYC